MIRPQSMMFTLFGDYIIYRGEEVWVGTLIQIMAQFGLSEQAVRSALSRMTRGGWLRGRQVGNRSFYSLTPRGKRLLESGRRRIFVRRGGEWDGRWRILVYSIPERQREVREALRKQLTWLGFGPLGSGTWVTPHRLDEEVAALVETLGVRDRVELFEAAHVGFGDAQALARRCWDLDALNTRYRAFVEHWAPRQAALQERLARGDEVPPAECFVERFLLIHEYRRFFFLDPELPPALLPADWQGAAAAQLFHAYHTLLGERANAYLDSVWEDPPTGRKRGPRQAVPEPAAVELLAASYRAAPHTNGVLGGPGSVAADGATGRPLSATAEG
ncbi:MAG: phenylacetic acid degradation operon negative regulatory protein PaaX [Chloroflexi bacterium]|nr:phenylacetic acid degradation operon negative regulatory protein PaaX [Chloroflexota bacterium]